ncbi:transmembrane protein 176B [Dipodomys spectabilis]|uniref:transmembrane protein 176B n=1 Tax=Dipodomys spectabilis TaxID=105255 RepID=UPI001C540841|nr:transmembrane protein 176B [Dipodomys spectabilis]
MTQPTVTVNGVDMDCAQPQPYHIDIHFHQESTLAELLKSGSLLKQLFSCPRDAGSSKARISYKQLAIGVTQILLGLVSGALGVSFYFGPWAQLRTSGCAFWAGSAAILAGAGVIIHQKHRGKLSGFLSLLLTLACMATAVAAAVFGVRSLIRQTDGSYSSEIYSLCEKPDPVYTTSGYIKLWRSSYDMDWREERCKSYMKTLMNLFLAFCALFTVICILKVILSLASLGLSLQSSTPLNSSREVLLDTDDRESEKKLLGENAEHLSASKKLPEAIIP